MSNRFGVGSAHSYAATIEDLERCRRRVYHYAANQFATYDPYFQGLIRTLGNAGKDGYYTHELKPEDHAIIHWALYQIGP